MDTLAIGNASFEKLIELFELDNQTGLISNPITLSTSINDGSGIAFSPDNSKLYVRTWVTPALVLQYDLSVGDSASIVASMDTVGFTNFGVASLQLAPDGKIYAANFSKSYLGVINNPNELGIACNYVDSAVYLAGRMCRMGLPNFSESNFNPEKPDFTVDFDTVCPQFAASFSGSNPYTANSWLWDFGDTASANNTDTLQNPLHAFSDTGTYNVQLVMIGKCWSDTVTNTIYVQPNYLTDNLGNDTTICYGDSVTLNAGNAGSSYLWSTGDTLQTLTADTGIYYVQIYDSVCSRTDTITINQFSQIVVSLGNDTSICKGGSAMLDAGNLGASYLWSTAATTQMIIVDTGTYFVGVIKNGCSGSDTITISQWPEISVSLGNDTTICPIALLILDAQNTGSVYLWSTGNTTQTTIVDTTGTYYVEVFKNGCTGTDTINIIQSQLMAMILSGDTTINLGTSILLSATVAGGTSYTWDPQAGLSCTSCLNPLANPEETTTYILTITDTIGCTDMDTVTIIVDATSVIFIPDIFSPNNDGNNDVLYVRGKGIADINFVVYDRWGELVFETTDITIGWDGTYKGKPMNPAVFVYHVTGSFVNGNEINETGNFALVR